MHEAFWNGLFDVRWEEAPLGPEAVRLVRRLRERGYAERTCRDPLPARKVKAAGTPARTSSNGSKTSEPPKVMLSSVQSAILLTPLTPRLTNLMTRRALARSHNPQLHIKRILLRQPDDKAGNAGNRRRPAGLAPVARVELARSQLAVPGQQRRWRHGEDFGPAAAGYEPGQRGEPYPVGRLVTHPAGVAAQHRVLVPEYQQLSILRPVRAGHQDGQAEYPAN
jgi:hypothetical protein